MEKKKREREKLLRFSKRRRQGGNGNLVQGGKRRANLLTAIIAGVRKYNVVNSTFSRTDSFCLSLSLPLSLCLLSLLLSPLSHSETISGQSFCNPIDPTGHIRVVTVMPHRESKLSS